MPFIGRRAPERDRHRTARAEVEALAGALAAPGGRHRGGDDVLEGVSGAHPTVVAGRPPAVGEPVLVQGRLPVVPEEVAVQAGGDVVPRAGSRRSVRCRVTYQSGSRPSAAIASSQRDRWKCSLHSWNVPPARHTRSITRPIRRSPRLAMPSANVAAGSCQRICAPDRFTSSRSSPILRCSSSTQFCPNHWNGVCGFGTNPPTDAVQLAFFVYFRADLDDLAGELGDAERVVVGLGGHAGEEVELHPLPALRVRAVDRGVEVVVGDELVDHLPDPPRAALGREREPGAAHLLDLAGDADGERVDPQRRQREADVAAALLLVHDARRPARRCPRSRRSTGT